jgi:hypothetical protein
LCLFVLSLSVASLAFGQGGTGTITGIVTDPSGSVVAGALVQAKNAETGVTYSGATTNAGAYTISNVPVGNYVVTTTVQGFKTYTHTNLTVGAAQVLRENIVLEVGTSAESVTVSAEASLLKTETGDLSHNVTIEQIDDLPLMGIGTANAGTSGYRNPYNTLLTLPGVSSYSSSGQFTLNGLGGNMTETMRIEGQDATSRFFGTYNYTQMAQPGADSIQEISYQTSNYAAEYGQAGSAVINMTMKSGTNQYHGSGYEYFVNEDLNAGDPFTQNASGIGKLRPINRRNDFGGTLGGPVVIPKIYNGHNRTFFFWSYEQFREHTAYDFTDTVPAPAYLQGNFSAISANGTCSLCGPLGISPASLTTDPIGAPVFANEIYDPATRTMATSGPYAGQGYASPFPNNTIPLTRFDPITVKFLNLFQSLGVTAQNSNLSENYAGIIGGNRYSDIPSIKIDQIIDDKDKLSFYWSLNNTQSQISAPLGNADGLPEEIGEYRGTFIPTWTTRLNYDRTITPTLLLHFGAGYLHTTFSDRAPFLSFNPSQFGLTNFEINRQFPSITGMCTTGFFSAACTNATGGMQPVGTAGQIQSLSYEEKPSFNGNATWVHGKHTYKAGAELYLEQLPSGSFAGVTLATGLNATQEPFTPTNSFLGAINGYTTGFGFASFLLGDYGSYSALNALLGLAPQSSTTQSPQENYREGSQQWGLFVQDSWKVARKLTVDYGVRWDLATPEHEQYGRLGQLDAGLANPVAGGRLGAVQYASTCNCDFYKSAYPYALGPRLGVAYQITPRTVFRAGWGYTYQFVAAAAGGIVSTNGIANLPALNPSWVPVAQQYVNIETPGSIVQPQWPVTNPYIYPNPGAVGPAPLVPDQNENRPPRVNQFSFGIQQQITRNFVFEASYVGNRGVWEQGAAFPAGGPYGFFSQISPAKYAQYGLYPYPGTGPCSSGSGVCPSSTYNNYGDFTLLNEPLGAAQSAMAAKGFPNFVPYAGFPLSSTLQSALYPYPQFGNITISGSPTGSSIYNSLQMKATKRFSHGLQAGGAFTWAKGFTRATPQDFFNPASSQWDLQQIPPLDLTFNFLYTVPKASWEPRWANLITKDWQIGGYANYQSGMFLTPPASPTNNFLGSEDIRVPGQPLYSPGVDPNNLSTYNPYYTQVLNPNAWQACPVNTTCTATGTLYSDFRAPRTPTENANIGRNFRMGKEGRFNLFIRADFVNIFNRTLMAAPSTSVNPAIPASKNNLGIYTSGFGIIDAYLTPGTASALPAQSTNFVLQPRTGTLIARFSF